MLTSMSTTGRHEGWLAEEGGHARGHLHLPCCLTRTCLLLFLLLQEFGLEDDVQKFANEMERLERMQVAAAAAASSGAAAPRPGTALSRLTAQRPPTAGSRTGPLPGLPMPPALVMQQQKANGMLRPPSMGKP